MPASLARICAASGTGIASNAIRVMRMVIRVFGLRELCVDCSADLVESLAFAVQSYRKAPLSLADRTIPRHSFGFIAGEKGIEFHPVGTPAVTVDAVDDLRDLANRVEKRNKFWVLLEVFTLENVFARNTGPRCWMLWRSVRDTGRQHQSGHAHR